MQLPGPTSTTKRGGDEVTLATDSLDREKIQRIEEVTSDYNANPELSNHRQKLWKQ